MLDPASNEPPGTNNKREEKEKEEEVEKEKEEEEVEKEKEEEEVVVDVITELRLSLHDSVVDYVPTQPIPLHTAGRMVLVFREITVCTNIMPAAMESIIAVKVQDCSVRMAGRPTPYSQCEAVCGYFDGGGGGGGTSGGTTNNTNNNTTNTNNTTTNTNNNTFNTNTNNNTTNDTTTNNRPHMRLNVWDLQQILDDAAFAMVGQLDYINVTVTSRPTLDPYSQQRHQVSGRYC
jgi:hypothetical protein